MKTLSVRQPYASLICYGVKTVENRTWKTDYRGRLLIHASGGAVSFFDDLSVPQNILDEWDECLKIDDWNCPECASARMPNVYRMGRDFYKFYGLERGDPWPTKQAIRKRGGFCQATAIIGEVTLVDIAKDSTDDFAEPGHFHWILANAKVYEKPIINVVGRLRLWDFNLDSNIV